MTNSMYGEKFFLIWSSVSMKTSEKNNIFEIVTFVKLYCHALHLVIQSCQSLFSASRLRFCDTF